MTVAARLLAVLALLVGVSLVAVPAPAQARAQSGSVIVTIEDVAPLVPTPSTTPVPMTFAVRLTNTTDQVLRKLRLVAERDNPVDSQSGLTTEFATTTQPDNGLSVPTADGKDVEVAALAPHRSVILAYRITAGTDTSVSPSLCLCQQVIYPIWFGAQAVEASGATTILGGARTYVPSLTERPERTPVAWLWPLIDRPHRLTSDSVFFDDDLAASVAPGGRLDRALQVVEDVGATVPMTLVIDPELLDELAVMATGRYTVAVPGQAKTAGQGQAVAASWLTRLTGVLASDTGVDLTLTPYADPDQQALVDTGSSWATTLPSAMQQRITPILAGRPLDHDLAWPSGGAITGAGLRALVAGGANTLVLDQSGLVRSQRRATVTLVHLASGPAAADAAVTIPSVQVAAQSVLETGGQGFRVLPRLLATLAVRQITAAANSRKPTMIVVTPQRYVDPVVDRADRVIRATSSGALAGGVSVRGAVATGSPAAGRLASTLPTRRHLSAGLLASVLRVDDDLPILVDLLKTNTTPSPAGLLTGFAAGRERLVSAAWASGPVAGDDSTPSPAWTTLGGGGDAAGNAHARAMDANIVALLRSVHIVKPKSGSYTLASSDSRLPVAVKNDSGYTVVARVDVRTIDNLPGLSATPLVQVVPPHTQVSLRIKTSVERAGTIPVEAQLATASDLTFGRPIRLTVHSTALGTIGLIITTVAGAILAVALLIRFAILVRRRRTRRATLRPADIPQREPAA